MKQYLLSIYQPEGGTPPPEVLARVMADLDAVNREMKAAGAWVFAGGLHPSSAATVLRLDGDQVLVSDGPFVEGREHLGGICVIAAPDLEAALSWAAKVARAITLPIEVRPFQDAAGG
jgi:hypothetical protein